MAGALFEPSGGAFVPTEHAQGPWADGLLHGGPVNGLLASELDRLARAAGLQLTRITIDLFHPVPLRPLQVDVQPVRQGRRLLVADAVLRDGDTAVARATGLFLRPEPGGVEPGEGAMPPGPDGLPTSSLGEGMKFDGPRREGFHTTVEVRWARTREDLGPSAGWFHLPIPVVAGEAVTPLVLTVAVCDFVNALTKHGAGRGPGYINADTTVYLSRPPLGDWICIESKRELGPQGLGYSRANVYDQHGLVGAAVQAILPQTMR